MTVSENILPFNEGDADVVVLQCDSGVSYSCDVRSLTITYLLCQVFDLISIYLVTIY